MREEDLAGAVELGGRLRGLLLGVLDALPTSHRTGHALTERLGIEGTTARRIIRATRDHADELEVLSRSPSPEALRSVARAGAGAIDPFVIAELHKTADRLENLSQRFGGRTAFIRLLREGGFAQEHAAAGAAIDPSVPIADRRLLTPGIATEDGHLVKDVRTGESWGVDSGGAIMPEGAVHDEPTGPLIAWSGGFDAEDPFARDPRVWSPNALDALADRCRAITRSWAADHALLLRPHARHILGDLNRCTRFVREVCESGPEPGRIGLALDPVGLLEPSMLRAAPDHLERIFGLLASRCRVLILTDLREPEGEITEDDPEFVALSPCPVDAGVLDASLLADLIRRHLPLETPIYLPFPDTAAQVAALDRHR
ncbi:MAG: hypothetical protein EA380_11695 [Phycisphaeraceae bacterium]|nr:MAG: hypothetical protein EA380_11695 [Phycisphaeraceae bacterium]